MANETDIVEHTAVFSDDADGLRRQSGTSGWLLYCAGG